ncbi:GNAT family N-acetyltransferase [Dysgonomonas sp. ZJ279]|uniref:GNAT family N-acetyltransferase n=1 Tax=Dysgonomonas sp. ZJ279 TaxID=2709796 RepID=UPI0013EAA601|nr:GNAT family N-acetyltransferase [Dysgonomonas sp. ZJ279]
MNNIKCQRIESDDVLKDCAEVLVKAYNSEPWNDNWTKEKALEKLECFYNSPRFIGLMVWEEDSLVGCCIGNIEPYYMGDYYYVKEMFVSPEYQNKGIGRKLMESIKKELNEINIKTIILFTGKDFFPYRFYLKSGFSEMEEMRMMSFGETE